MAIEEELRRRRFGEAVRLEVERSMPASTRALLIKGIGLSEEDCYDVAGMVDLTALWQLVSLDRPELLDPPWTPITPARLQPPDDDEPADVFAVIRAADVMVHHPYESFAASTERFIAQAAEELERAGYGTRAAGRLAARHDVDLHRAIELLDQGCPPELATKILL